MALTPRDKELTVSLSPELLQTIENCGKDIYHNNPFLAHTFCPIENGRKK